MVRVEILERLDGLLASTEVRQTRDEKRSGGADAGNVLRAILKVEVVAMPTREQMQADFERALRTMDQFTAGEARVQRAARKIHDLPRVYSDRLHEYVRGEFGKLWALAQVKDRYDE